MKVLSRKLTIYRCKNLTVHTLTPCHWSLKSRMLLQPSALPDTLAQFCEDYKRFFVRRKIVIGADWWETLQMYVSFN